MNGWLYLICPLESKDRFPDRVVKIAEMSQEEAKTILKGPARRVLFFFGLYVGV